MRFYPIALLLAAPSMLLGADPEITGLTHDKTSGRTTVKWQNINAKNGVVVYRSDRKLQGDELFFAQKFIFPAT